MLFSKDSQTHIKTAERFVIYSDEIAGSGRVYFVVALLATPASEASGGSLSDYQHCVLLTEDGHRWEGSDRTQVMGGVQALRPGLETFDFLAGYVPRGPYASELDNELSQWLLSLDGRSIASLEEGELMALSEGYERGRRLGLLVAINDTSEPHSSITKQLRRRDKESPFLRSNARVSVKENKQL